MRGFRRQAGDDGAAILRQPGQQGAAEPVIGGGGEEIPMPEPGGDAGARDLRRLGKILARAVLQPVMRQVAAAHPRRVGAQRAQIPQPAEAMRGGTPQQRAIARRPADAGLPGQARLERPGGAEHLQLARHQPCAARRIARPEVLEAATRRLGHPHRLEAGDPPFRAADQVWHGVPLSAATACA